MFLVGHRPTNVNIVVSTLKSIDFLATFPVALLLLVFDYVPNQKVTTHNVATIMKANKSMRFQLDTEFYNCQINIGETKTQGDTWFESKSQKKSTMFSLTINMQKPRDLTTPVGLLNKVLEQFPNKSSNRLSWYATNVCNLLVYVLYLMRNEKEEEKDDKKRNMRMKNQDNIFNLRNHFKKDDPCQHNQFAHLFNNIMYHPNQAEFTYSEEQQIYTFYFPCANVDTWAFTNKNIPRTIQSSIALMMSNSTFYPFQTRLFNIHGQQLL